jgi:NAD(P)H-hydrate epimerase
MKALTAAEMREVDRLTTERFGIPSLQLMEAAGRGVAEVFRQNYLERSLDRGHLPRSISVLCGKGNNGGDGFVAARHLQTAAVRVHVYLFARPSELHGDAATNFQRWTEVDGGVTCVLDEAAWESAWSEIAAADVIIDAIFGTGFRGTAAGAAGQAIEDLNRLSQNATAPRPSLILAVDTPSGLPADEQPITGPVLYAHRTATFTAPKTSQLTSPQSAAVGYLDVVNIGSPAALVEEIGRGHIRWPEPEEFAHFPLVRPVDAHKGTFGHVLVVAGSLGKSGAAALAGYAALCGGAGLVTVATPEPVLPMVASTHAEYMTEPLGATSHGAVSTQNLSNQRFAQIVEGKTVLAIGPGLGTHPETQEFVRSVVGQTELPMVLDADGLNAFSGRANQLRDRKSPFLAITPHPGEMSRLLDKPTRAIQQDRVKAAQEAARCWNVHVVLKGSHTVIAAPDGQVFVNTTGNPGLAKGGTGDALTGFLAALTAQFKTDDWLRVLALGVYLHGSAGTLAAVANDLSGVLAGDVAKWLPKTRHKLLLELQKRG